MNQLLDLFFLYLRSIPFIFSTNPNASIFKPVGFTISIYQVPNGNITFGENVVFFGNLSQEGHHQIMEEGSILLDWDLHLVNSDVVHLSKTSDKAGQIEVIFNNTEPVAVKAISCKATSTISGSVIAEVLYPITFSKDKTRKNSKSDCTGKIVTLPSPLNVSASYIEGRSVVISWTAPVIEDDLPEILEYAVEYKRTMSDWRNGIEKVTLPVTQTSAHVKNLKPWTTYHFRVVAIYLTGQSAPSYTVVVLTPEERPTGAPVNVKVKVLNDNTLQISWKPAPRSTWNGAILGYNIGSRRASSSQEESYTFHVLTVMELLGRPCVHDISVADSSLPYKVVVQAFNNVGSGPLSLEAITESQEEAIKN